MRIPLLSAAAALLACAVTLQPLSMAAAQGGFTPLGAPPFVTPLPEILPDNWAVFRIAAPGGSKVELHANFPSGLQPSVVPMFEGADGVWFEVVGPIEPELYNYSYDVDGAQALDPSNPHAVAASQQLLVPGPGSALYAVRDVPHGTVP